MKLNKNIKQIVRSERGGALILVFIGAIILSITGVSMLRQSQTEYTISSNSYFDKVALFAADAGINEGIRTMRNDNDPPSVIIDESTIITDNGEPDGKTIHFRTLYTGTIPDTEGNVANNVTGMQELPPPVLPGQSLNSGLVAAGWNLTVSARIYMDQAEMDNNIRPKARKEVQTMLITLASLGH